MTPLQALERIGNRGLNDYGEATIKTVFKEEYNLLTSLITPPTADEVSEALSKVFGHTHYYDEELRDFWCEEFGSDDHMLTWYLSNEPLNELVDYPHLMTLIGRFYEAQE